MKRLLSNIVYDLQLQIRTKSLIILFIVMMGIFMLAQFNQINDFKTEVNMYEIAYQNSKEAGNDPEEILKQDYNINNSKENKLEVIDNPLRYQYESMKESRNSLEGRNVIVTYLENTLLVYLSLVITIYMIYVSCFEFSELTFKTRLLMGNSTTISLSKLIAGMIVVTGTFIVSLLLSSLIVQPWIIQATKDYAFNHPLTQYSITHILKVGFMSYIILMLYSIFGFSLGSLLRKTSIATVIFLVLHLVVPVLGKYDYKNLVLTIYRDIFGKLMDSTVHIIDGVNITTAFALLTLYSVIVLIFAFIRFKIDKRGGVLQ